MDVFEYLFKWRRDADGTCVSQAEYRQLQAAQKLADATNHTAPEADKPGLQLEEQHREARLQHIGARLLDAFGRAKGDFNRSASRDHER